MGGYIYEYKYLVTKLQKRLQIYKKGERGSGARRNIENR